ncbi:MAG: hypothetical protein Ta2D_13210 [Rickettsiales bacterium]|nr:MAG: hypothetical protein Ta2D_13210 [Rickettsiales bacterium]
MSNKNNISNSANNSNNANVILIIVIFSILLTPITKINKQEILKLEKENRNANRYKTLDNKESINYSYGSDFNRWFGDRFRVRDEFLDFKRKKIESSFFLNRKYLEAKVFYNFPVSIGFPKNEEITISDEEQKLIEANIEKLYKWCNSHNIKCYMVWAPDATFAVRSKINFSNDKLENFDINKINKNIISLHKEWMQHNYNDTEFMYYIDYKNNNGSVDIHSTDNANYLAYKKTMESIKKDIPQMKIAIEDDFYIHCNQKMMFYQFYMNIKNKIDFFNNLTNEEKNNKDCKYYKYYLLKEFTDLTSFQNKNTHNAVTFFTNNSTALNKNLTVIGQASYFDAFTLPFLYNFKKVQSFNNNIGKNITIKDYEKEILDFKTDVLIILFSSYRESSNFVDDLSSFFKH